MPEHQQVLNARRKVKLLRQRYEAQLRATRKREANLHAHYRGEETCPEAEDPDFGQGDGCWGCCLRGAEEDKAGLKALFDSANARAKAAEAENTRLRGQVEALMPYVQHDDGGCLFYGCICGLDAAITATSEQPSEEGTDAG
jgi:hypothetical protein